MVWLIERAAGKEVDSIVPSQYIGHSLDGLGN